MVRQGESSEQIILYSKITHGILAILIILSLGGFIYYQAVPPSDLPLDEEKIAQLAKEKLTEHSEEITKEVVSFASKTVPPVTNELYRQGKKNWPKYQALLKDQGNELISRSEEILVAELKNQYGDYFKKHKSVLKEEFPDAASEEEIDKFIEEMQQAGDQLIARYHLEQFHEEVVSLKKNWLAIQPFDVSEKDMPALYSQLSEYFSDWVVLTFSDRAQETVLSE